MHLLEVEKLTGLSRKIIKLYESLGLIKPSKNNEHGVKTYTLKEVQLLKNIKFLRSIGVSLEEIKVLIDKDESLESLMEEKIKEIEIKQENLKNLKKICKNIKSNNESFNSFNLTNYEKEIELLKESGTDILGKNIERRKKLSLVFLRILMVLFLISIVVLIFLATKKEQLSVPVVLVLVAFPGMFIIGIIDTIKETVKEIENVEIKKVI